MGLEKSILHGLNGAASLRGRYGQLDRNRAAPRPWKDGWLCLIYIVRQKFPRVQVSLPLFHRKGIQSVYFLSFPEVTLGS
jgi:hypothetical protein